MDASPTSSLCLSVSSEIGIYCLCIFSSKLCTCTWKCILRWRFKDLELFCFRFFGLDLFEKSYFSAFSYQILIVETWTWNLIQNCWFNEDNFTNVKVRIISENQNLSFVNETINRGQSRILRPIQFNFFTIFLCNSKKV